MNLLIAGDTVPKENNIELFTNGNIKEILGDKLDEIWEKADYKIFNLEAPITESNKKIKKCGPNLKIEPQAIHGIKKMNPTVVCLANNHIMDYGKEGMEDTVKILNENDIAYLGIGNRIQDLIKSYIIQTENKKIAIYNCCETEFSIATLNFPGANRCNLLDLEDDIKKLRDENDYLIIIYHGGKEYYRYPSPYLQDLCRRMIDYGADLVTCQHSHCIGCYEKYNEKTIIYGQGNFIFSGKDNEFWNTSLILNIDISNKFNLSFIPIKATDKGIRLANNKEKEQVIKLFEQRSQEIENRDFVERNYNKFAKEYLYRYLQCCLGNKFVFRIINKLGFQGLTKKWYSEENFLGLLNLLECEAHRELFISGIKEEIYYNNGGSK